MAHLLVSEIFPPVVGGSGRWFWEIYRRQPRSDYVIVAGEDPKQLQFDRTHDLRVVRASLRLPDLGIFSLRGLRDYWRAYQTVAGVVRAQHITKIHSGRCLPEGWVAWMLRRCHGLPYICYAHGEEVNVSASRDAPGVLSSRQLRWMTRQVLWGADFIIANSRNTRRILQTTWDLPAHRVRVLHPGVDAKRFTPALPDPVGRARLGWDNRPVVLTVGRLQKRKGQDQMILALRAIRRRIPDVLYAIVGDGEERLALQELSAREGMGDSVQFLGEVPDEILLSCYQQCDLCALPNRQVGSDIEGFGMVLVEAQACGKPVVAGASGGTAETMSIPETGRVVNCDGPDELGELVVGLLSDRERLARMGREARQWAVKHFDWDALSRQFQGLLQPGRSAAVR